MSRARDDDPEPPARVTLTITISGPPGKRDGRLYRQLEAAVKATKAGMETWEDPTEKLSGQGESGPFSWWFSLEPSEEDDDE